MVLCVASLNERLVWIDCEMTGLSLENDALIEVAALVTDFDLNVLGDGVDIIIKPPAEALEQMEPFDREVLAMRHFEELSNAETAAILGIEPPAASKRYIRAIRRLKAILDAVPGFFP